MGFGTAKSACATGISGLPSAIAWIGPRGGVTQAIQSPPPKLAPAQPESPHPQTAITLTAGR
jgi:hypothetical protein